VPRSLGNKIFGSQSFGDNSFSSNGFGGDNFAGDSLRRVLLRRVLWPLIAILLLGILLSYVLARHAAVNAYDASLLDAASDLSNQIEFHDKKFALELPSAAAEMLAINNEDRVIYAVRIDGGSLVAGDQSLFGLSTLAAGENYEFQDIELSGRLYRSIVLRREQHGAQLLFVVAQTVKGRENLLRDIFFSMLILGGALVLVSIAVVVNGVRMGLRPVESLRNDIASRSPNDLKPLADKSAPVELLPIIHGINELLEKLATSFAGYRRFIADAAHQLRTPLAALGSQLEVNLIQPPADVSALLRELLATTQRTSHLAAQLLSLARLEHTDGSAIDSRPVDFRVLAQETASEFVLRAARKEVELEFSIEPIVVRGSAILLRELLSNLLDNAVNYAPPHSVINVSLQRCGANVELVVMDAGVGVVDAELSKLGTPFHQLPTSLPNGCGLGLAIVREIAHIHGGDVMFEAGARGVGLLVRVHFAAVDV